jgi:hypothetical protein
MYTNTKLIKCNAAVKIRNFSVLHDVQRVRCHNCAFKVIGDIWPKERKNKAQFCIRVLNRSIACNANKQRVEKKSSSKWMDLQNGQKPGFGSQTPAERKEVERSQPSKTDRFHQTKQKQQWQQLVSSQVMRSVNHYQSTA